MMLWPVDSASERASRDREWAQLMDRRSTVVSLLRSAHGQLRMVGRAGIGEPPEEPAAEEMSSLRRDGRLSWRGMELAKDLFRAFDADADGQLSANEYADYAAGVGAPDEETRGSSSSVSWAQFVAHRAAVETARPIETDCLAVGLSGAPESSTEWARCGREFDRLDWSCTKSQRASSESGLRGKVPIAAFDELCFACGGVYWSGEVELLVRTQRSHQLACAAVRAARRSLSSSSSSELDDGQSRCAADDLDHVSRDAFLAWWFSNRPRGHDPRSSFAAAALAASKSIARAALGASRALDHVARAVAPLVDRGLLHFARVQAAKAGKDGAVNVVANVAGDHNDDDDDPGCAAELRFGPTPPGFTSERQIPGDVGSSLVLDFATRPGVDMSDLVRLKKLTGEVCKRYLEPRLERVCAGYRGIRVLIVERAVLRIQVLWTLEATLDKWIERRAHLRGLGLLDLVFEASVGVRSSRSLARLVTAAEGGPAPMMRLAASLSMRYARELVGLLLSEVAWARVDARTIAAREREAGTEAERRARERTLHTHGAILAPGETPVSVPRPGATASRCQSGDDDSRRTVHETTVESLLEAHLRRAARVVSGTRQLRLELAFDDIKQMLLDSSLARTLLGAETIDALRAVLDDDDDDDDAGGGLVARWRDLCDSLTAELDDLDTDVTRVEDAEAARLRRLEQAEAARLASMSDVERKRLAFAAQVQTLQRKLGATLGVDLQSPASKRRQQQQQGPEDSPHEAHVDQIRRLEVDQAKAARTAIDCYSLCCTLLTGPTKLTAHSGPAHVSIDLDGLDLFNVLP